MKQRGLLLKLTLPLLSLLAIPTIHAETLRHAVEQTILSNPNIQISSQERLQIDQELRQSQALFYPSVDINGDIGPERNKNSSTRVQWKTLNRREAGVSLTENIFAGFGDINRVRENKNRVEASAFRVNSRAQNTGFEATEAYINVLRNQKLVQIAKNNVQANFRYYNMIRKRGESGLGRTADTAQARGRLSLARSNLFAAQNNLKDTNATYIRVIGHPPINISLPRIANGMIPNTKQAAVNYALANHPSIRATKANLVAREHQRKVAQANFYPKLDLVLNSRRGTDLEGIDTVNHDDSALVFLTYNIYRGGADVARVQQVAHQKQQAFEEIRSTERDVAQSVRFAWNALQTSRRQLKDLQIHMNKSKETVVAYQKQFTLGKRTLVDLLNAENEYFSASRSYANGRFDVLLGRYQVLTSMGRLLDALSIQLPTTAKAVIPNGSMPQHSGNNHNAPGKLGSTTGPHPTPATNSTVNAQPSSASAAHGSRPASISSVPTKPAHLAPATTQANSGWAVQVGVFAMRQHADTLVAKLRANNYPAFNRRMQTSRGLDYVVMVGPEMSHREASKLTQQLNREFNLNGFVIALNQAKRRFR